MYKYVHIKEFEILLFETKIGNNRNLMWSNSWIVHYNTLYTSMMSSNVHSNNNIYKYISILPDLPTVEYCSMLVIAAKYFQREVCIMKWIIRRINTYIWKDLHRCILLSNINKHDPKAPGVKSNMYTKRWHQNHFRRKWGGNMFFFLLKTINRSILKCNPPVLVIATACKAFPDLLLLLRPTIYSLILIWYKCLPFFLYQSVMND